jgi:hypothetical protein
VSSAERRLCFCGAVVGALMLPSAAFAHGKSAPTATNFEARIDRIAPPTNAAEARAVDGDRALWLRARPDATVLIPGAAGEPLLRFDRAGVFVNLRSLTAQSDRIDRLDLRPDPNPHARPLWHRLTSRHAYLWHEHRLHALEPLAADHRSTAVLGRWSVPLQIDGHRHALKGVLVYHRPRPLWPWILLAAALAVASAGTLAVSVAVARQVAVAGALAGTLLVWTVRIGRELYGRPSVGVGGYIEIGLTSLVGLALLYGLLHRQQGVRLFTAFLAGFGCLYQGLTMQAVLTHAVALTVLPTLLARVAVAVILGLGGGVLAITLREQFGGGESEEPFEQRTEAPAREPQPAQKAGRA